MELERFSRGLLSGAVNDRVREHVDSCGSCQLALQSTSGSPPNDADVTIAHAPATDVITAGSPTAGSDDVTVIAPSTAPTASRIDATQAMSPADAKTKFDQAAAQMYPNIDGYQILGILGQGGMGVVYRAVQVNLKRSVALKVLPAALVASNPTVIARFRREATSAARLHHTNIIPVYDFGESPQAYYYAMELIEGEPLTDIIRRGADQRAAAPAHTRMSDRLRSVVDVSVATLQQGPDKSEVGAGSSIVSTVTVGRSYHRQVARWFADVADALHYAHQEGVIHRDIKPANLILSNDGRIMIADFGLAKTTEEHSMTQAGSFLGTLRYASPEQAQGKSAELDHRTDIYSLGVTLYELLCYTPAYPGTSQKELLNAILNRDPVQPRKIVPAIPSELETICIKMMEKDAVARYATAKSVADDLRRFLNDLPIAAKRPSIASRAIKFCKRHRALVTAVSAVVLLSASTAFLVHARAQQRLAKIDSHYESGMYYASNLKWEKSEQAFLQALELDPANVKTMVGLAWMKTEQLKKERDRTTTAQLEDLDRLCRRILALDPNNLNVLSYHSIVLKNLKRYDEAISATKKVIELQPDFYAAWANLGAYYAITGDLKSAEEKLRHGSKLAESSETPRAVDQANVWRTLAALELYLGRPEAIEHIMLAIKAKRDDIPSWLLRIRARLALEGYVDAAEALNYAKLADHLAVEENPRAKRLRALAHLRVGEWDAAILHARHAIDLRDNPAVNHLILGIAEARKGNSAAAHAHLEQATLTWPEELSDRPFAASYDEGVLWFESAVELSELKNEANSLLDAEVP